MLAFRVEIKRTYLHVNNKNLGFAPMGVFQHIIKLRNQKFFFAFYFRIDHTTYLPHITFSIFYKVGSRQIYGPFVLEINLFYPSGECTLRWLTF
jgi:hypothetical protein